MTTDKELIVELTRENERLKKTLEEAHTCLRQFEKAHAHLRQCFLKEESPDKVEPVSYITYEQMTLAL